MVSAGLHYRDWDFIPRCLFKLPELRNRLLSPPVMPLNPSFFHAACLSCRKLMSQLHKCDRCMTIQTENTYYIEIYMNIDIDGYDLTIFVYGFESLFTKEVCVCL